MESLIGQTLHGRYQIQVLLGKKIGRRTFLATDLETQSSVVIKLLLFGPDFSWEDLKLFEREAKTLKALNHPAIPSYLDSFDIDAETGQGFALVQSYIDAVPLDAAVQSGRRFSEAELVEIADQLLAILVYLHGQVPPVIHRDIKPSNILLSNRSGHRVGDLYLVDFGSVQTVADKKNDTITIVGSYGYIPLEQFTGQTVPASDLYSLGMTLVYLIAGRHPADLSQVNGKVQFDSSAIDKRFARWLEKMTHFQLDKRFESAQIALAALKSEDGSYGSHIDLRPKNSQVEVFRDRDRLEIKTLQQPIVGSCLGCLGLAAVTILGFSLTGAIGGVLTMALASLIFIIYANQLPSCKSVITIERGGKISKFIQTKATKQNIKFSAAEDISLLIYSPGYTFDRYINEKGNTIQGGKVTIYPKLSVFAGSVEYSIGHSLLSQAELWWLGQELSDFLDLELQIVYPTPKVPPEQTCGCGC
ncbi:serine/threonine protein kinase [Nodosilinea nodulosa]|uniref:serine/threonine protein kinase n=1 Tax=Nodosilinea nodulosa TaxID=416001 RepID=UPI0003154D98|nr:serine/threonine-protein kinase [Nodosilinea nodulosa]